jgi:hypothetical protein
MACVSVNVGKTRGTGGGGAGMVTGAGTGAGGVIVTVTGALGGWAKAEAAQLAAIPIRATRVQRKAIDPVLLQQTRTRLKPRFPYCPAPI